MSLYPIIIFILDNVEQEEQLLQVDPPYAIPNKGDVLTHKGKNYDVYDRTIDIHNQVIKIYARTR